MAHRSQANDSAQSEAQSVRRMLCTRIKGRWRSCQGSRFCPCPTLCPLALPLHPRLAAVYCMRSFHVRQTVRWYSLLCKQRRTVQTHTHFRTHPQAHPACCAADANTWPNVRGWFGSTWRHICTAGAAAAARGESTVLGAPGWSDSNWRQIGTVA